MPDCDAALISSNYVGALSDTVYVQAPSWADGGFRFSNTESRSNEIESVELDLDAGTATVVTCEVDAAIQMNAAGDTVDDTYQSTRRAWTLVSDGTTWRGAELIDLVIAEGEENDLCA